MNGISEQGSILTGDALEKYTRKRGLCHICASVVTHLPCNSRFHILTKRRWEPLTVPTDDGGAYLVYKGFCMQPTCYTLKQARQLLGEASDVSSSSYQIARRPSSISENDWSVRSFASGLGSMPDLYHSQQRSPIQSKVKRSESLSYIKQGQISFQSSSSTYNNTVMATKNALSNSTVLGAKLLDFINNPLATTLDLSEVRLTSRSIPSLVEALERTYASNTRNSKKRRPPLRELILNKCHVGRHTQRLDTLISGIMENRAHKNIPSLSLRNNGICKKGAVCLAPLVAAHTISVLDLSRNDLENEGVSTIIEAMLNVDTSDDIEWNSCKIQRLNLSRNKIIDFSPITLEFFRTTQTLQVLSLEGNFLRDAAISLMAKALIQNFHLPLQDLFLGSNAFSDEGLISLAEFIQVSTNLKVLSVGKNNISSIGALVLKETLHTCNAPMEEILGLDDNHLITDKTVVAAIEKQLDVMVQNRLYQSESRSIMSTSSCSTTSSPLRTNYRPESTSTSRPESISTERTNEPIASNKTSNRKFVFTPNKPIVKNKIFQWIESNYSAVSSLVVSESDNESITTRGSFDDNSQRSICSLIDPSDHFGGFSIGENHDDWTSGVCQTMSGQKSEIKNNAPDEEGFEVELPKLFIEKFLDSSYKTTNMPVVRQISSEDSLSSSITSTPNDSPAQISNNRIKLRDGERSTSWNKLSRINNKELLHSSVSEEKEEDIPSRTLFRTRSALELEVRRREADIEAARHSDNPDLIRQGINSQKRMQSLLPLRPGLPDRNQLENRVEELEQKLQDPSNHHMMLEERLELASAKSLCISLLEEEYRLEALLRVEAS
mmetsp:Transcript_30227/g.46113  ORF Transcript_30227/g.46113 Transcript_30227/m.46113 type:complete len:835 (+) Transcript_30227:64-2568(+)|eukprot:CAMPEP_0194252704 /NCGR_PEP_ID=MMETSP0158-20130606/28203_1 /TAXON_ID=33649 /ORGANISM="Thalassionema nitzschioides, Strain L26-B" /LENGTH=834 /DNA_ID=CAMNT_0038990179 /DNA_START=26 /DNA_END=2530 /DNA_ORIENTATION=+